MEIIVLGSEDFVRAPKGSTLTVETQNSTYLFLRGISNLVKVQGGKHLPKNVLCTTPIVKVGESMFLTLLNEDGSRKDTLITSRVKRMYFHLPLR